MKSETPAAPSRAGLVEDTRLTSLRRWAEGLPLLLLGCYAIVLLARFATRGDAYLSYFEDDYYYYLVVARNLVLHGWSSFDRVRSTNGYQPLWQLINTALYCIFRDQRALFLTLLLLVFLFVCFTFRALRRTQRVLGNGDGYGLACALFSVTFMAAISRTGMEVSLTLLLLVLFWQRMAGRPLEAQSPREALLSGLLASCVVLGRLDALIVVALYLLLTLYQPLGTRTAALRSLGYFAAGLLPIAVYFVWNHALFGTLLPISGVAKNLKTPWPPSASTLVSLFRPRGLSVLLTWPTCLFALLFALLRDRAPSQPEARNPAGQRVQLCVLLHPVLFYTILSFSSDWPIWSWYLYPLVPVAALLGPTALARIQPLGSGVLVERLTVASGCVCLGIVLGMLAPNATERLLYQQAKELEEFRHTHPGRYAMGGGAGIPGYVMNGSLVQVEGLMGDPALIGRIKRREPLVEALSALGVDYYATMLLSGPQPGPCYHLREPEISGLQSPVLAGELCAPVADFRNPAGHHLLVFDVHRLAAGGGSR